MYSRLIRLDVSQSAITLYIYRVRWYVPIRSRNPYKSRVKIQLLTQIGLFGPRGVGLPRGITSSSGVQILCAEECKFWAHSTKYMWRVHLVDTIG